MPDPSRTAATSATTSVRCWLKADLHLHTAEDHCDAVDFSAAELLELAAARGFNVLAITLHRAVLERPDLADRARELGILLLPGAELRVEGADVVVLNLSATEAAGIRTFDDLRRLRARRGGSLFVLAPHPFYPGSCSLGRDRMEANRDCFDAVEFCHLPVPLPPPWNPNSAAVAFAHRHALPLVATSDAHFRRGFGAHFSHVGLAAGTNPSAEAVFAAIRTGQIRRVRPAGGGLRHFLAVLGFVFLLHPWRKQHRRRRSVGPVTVLEPGISFCPAEPAN